MLAAVGIALVLVVFLAGVVVVTLTLLGAREQRKATPAAAGETVALPPKQASALLRQVSDAEIEFEIRGGRVVNAVRLYQEKTGAGAGEAKDAVAAWRDKLHAS